LLGSTSTDGAKSAGWPADRKRMQWPGPHDQEGLPNELLMTHAPMVCSTIPLPAEKRTRSRSGELTIVKIVVDQRIMAYTT
jgi:hypothetical protein